MKLSPGLLLLPLLAPLPFAAAGGSPAAPVVTSASLKAALERIRPSDIEADLRFLASDELAGRDTPSQGLRLAARYIEARLSRLGFTPAGEDGSFFDPYVLTRSFLDQGASSTVVVSGSDEQTLALGDDVYFFGVVSVDVDVDAPVVYVGTASEEDLGDLDLTGKVALCHASDAVSRDDRRSRCAALGAKLLIVAPDPASEDDGSRTARFAERMVTRGRLALAQEDALPQLYLRPGAVARFLRASTPPVVGQDLGVRLRHRRVLSAASERHVVENVAGLWPGSSRKLSEEVIIVSAHYDHVGVGDDGKIYNGADDNGSGTSGLLALADALSEYGPMRRSILLLWVSGEEKGLLGSEAWTKAPTLPEGLRPVADLNIDMIGRNAPDKLLITPTKDHPAYNFLTRMAETLGPKEGFDVLGSADDYWRRSDHANFSENLGIPVAFLFSDVHEDYHQPTDTVEKIDFDKISRVSRLVFRMMAELQNEDLEG